METVQCDHCGKDISQASYTLHEVHCKKNFFHCDCGQFLRISDRPQHQEEYHVVKNCLHCELQGPSYLLKEHDCPNKPRACQFCEAEIAIDQFKDHLYQCGSRTQQCFKCFGYIQNRDFEHHEATCNGEAPTSNPYSSIPMHQIEEDDPDLPSLENQDSDALPEITDEQIAKIEESIRIAGAEAGLSMEQIEEQLAKKVAEEIDKFCAEQLEKKILMSNIEKENRRVQRANRPNPAVTRGDFVYDRDSYFNPAYGFQPFSEIPREPREERLLSPSLTPQLSNEYSPHQDQSSNPEQMQVDEDHDIPDFDADERQLNEAILNSMQGAEATEVSANPEAPAAPEAPAVPEAPAAPEASESSLPEAPASENPPGQDDFGGEHSQYDMDLNKAIMESYKANQQ